VNIAPFVAAAAVAAAPAPVTFAFEGVVVTPGERIVVHADGFASTKPVRLYLVRSDLRAKVTSPRDPRLAFVVTLRPRRGHAMPRFTIPPLDSGTYAPWCVGCGLSRSGTLEIEMPTATSDSCPTSPAGPYGNGLLSTTIPSGGVMRGRVDPDGSIFNKPIWVPNGFSGQLVVSGKRLDAPSPPLRVVKVSWGSGSWASAIVFPSAGCWRLTGRVAGVSLSYVVKVEQ
jgi:hypothetical protein